ncbi:Fc.00g012050.m01.CDS01 [Cosmosporella sp. VM-42]
MDVLKESSAILASIANWAKNEENAERISFAYDTAGGWEGWAQVEIAHQLQRDQGYRFASNEHSTILREQPIYQSSERQKADIGIYRNGDPSKGAFLFELKCESSGNSAAFAREVLKDQEKVNAGLKSTHRPATIWVIGLSYSSEAARKMAAASNDFKEYQYGSGPVKIWWWKKCFTGDREEMEI